MGALGWVRGCAGLRSDCGCFPGLGALGASALPACHRHAADSSVTAVTVPCPASTKVHRPCTGTAEAEH